MSADARAPDHVPADQVGGFSLFHSPGMAPTPNGDPHAAVSCVHARERRVFYSAGNTREGLGTWIVPRADDQRRLLQDTATFSSFRRIFTTALGEDWPLIPLELDPPQHTVFRQVLLPLFSPKRVTEMEHIVRERAVSLIERIKARGASCEIMTDFAFPFAVNIFLRFIGLPDDRLEEFVAWANDLLHGTPEQRTGAARNILAFMDELAELRRRQPVDDFMTFIVGVEIEGRKLTAQEVRGVGVLTLVAGLDTVAAALGFDLRYLAENATDQDLLRREPDRIPAAAEEMLRAFSTVQMVRVAKRDVEFEGASIRKGDLVSCPSMMANRDPHEFPDPDKIDLARENNRHTAFSYGPHRCLGSHLARREIIIGLEEWLARVPPFRIKAGTAPIAFGGFVFGIKDLVLDWS